MTNDLIDRYLAAIAHELPESERADIAAELRDELMSGVEAQEKSLGRPLTDKELGAALAAFGMRVGIGITIVVFLARAAKEAWRPRESEPTVRAAA